MKFSTVFGASFGIELDLDRSFAGMQCGFGHAGTVIDRCGTSRRLQPLRHGRVREEPEIGEPRRRGVGQVRLGEAAERRLERGQIAGLLDGEAVARVLPAARQRRLQRREQEPEHRAEEKDEGHDARVARAGRVDRVQNAVVLEQRPEDDDERGGAEHRERSPERDVAVAAVSELVRDDGQHLGLVADSTSVS